MSYPIQFKGAKWYNCDLHLHTVASACFQDRTVTAEQWIQDAINKGLHCVAVTDHNTGMSIDEIKNAAIGKNITIFPGVEITCDTSKIHLLILFDSNADSNTIHDFLVRADIHREDFGKQDASTNKSIFEILEIANIDGAMVIPAHIDEYNGLESLSHANLEDLFLNKNINAVQVVHKKFLDPTLIVIGNEVLKNEINTYYGTPRPEIGESTIKKWYDAVQSAIQKKLSILTFSDNPHEPGNPKHGLWGIGQVSTWIKMSETPSLEGLRQAFLLPKFRVRNSFSDERQIFNYPALWIKSLKIENTILTKENEPLLFHFNPQLNTIIGGRGSGKSSILKFIRGLFNKSSDLDALQDILTEHNDFYKKQSGRPPKGAFTDSSKITIEFVRNEFIYKITASNIFNSENQIITIHKLLENEDWQEVTDTGFIDFFDFEHYSQKQIYEIAQEPNALRERIDNSIEEVIDLKRRRDFIKVSFLEKSSSIRVMILSLENKGKLETKLRDVQASITRLQESGVSAIITEKDLYDKEYQLLLNVYNQLDEKCKALENANIFISQDIIVSAPFSPTHFNELDSILNATKSDLNTVNELLGKGLEDLIIIRDKFIKDILETRWYADKQSKEAEFSALKETLAKDGINDISSFEMLNAEKEKLNIEILELNSSEENLTNEIAERIRLLSEYTLISKEISEKRQDFLNEIIKTDKIKIEIKQFRNKSDFEEKLRYILQRENNTFQNDIDALIDMCFTGLVERQIINFRNIFEKIKKGEDVSTFVSGHFVNLVKALTDAQLDEIAILLPEDEIEFKFMPSGTTGYRSLSTASAGQKTTAILTFILSHGIQPLILDQPEDDLDNRLVYELVVDRLLEAKNSRQIIVVTHNANIPVNGDSDYIISLDSESKYMKILHEGTVEQSEIKKEICDVMEGGQQAFDFRSRRYGQ